MIASGVSHKGKSRSKGCTFAQTKELDAFGETFGMNIDDGEDVLKSWSGCACTLFIILITLSYAYQKSEVLLLRQDMKISTFMSKQYFAEQDRFTYDDGFNFAVAFTAYDNLREW